MAAGSNSKHAAKIVTMPQSGYLHHNIEGDRNSQVMLFLHGFMGSSEDWGEVARRFSSDFCVVTVDLPGHGRSQIKNDDEYRMENCASQLVHLLDAITTRPVILVGYSMGGRVALYLALKHQHRFEKLVLEAASPGLKTEIERTERMAKNKKLADRLLKEPLERFVTAWYRQPLFSSLNERPDLKERLAASRQQNNAESLRRSLLYMGTGSQPSFWTSLENLRLPTLLLVGEKDSKFRAINEEMVKLWPSATLRVITDAGHNVHLEDPEAFIGAVTKFLES